MNVEEVDLDLVEDKVERVLREAEHEYLMLDNRPKKIALIISSVLPKPLLSSLLATIFNTLQASTVTILPASVMTAVGAGVRSALVVDIGWAEVTVSAVYEYREIMQWRSTRAGKSLSEAFAKMLDEQTKQAMCFEDVEEIVNRMAWCRSSEDVRQNLNETDPQNVDIRLPATNIPLQIQLRFDRLADPVEDVLFARGTTSSDLDDHDQPLHFLIYKALLHLPIDIRQLCMSRITFTGGVSNLPGLKQRLIQEVELLVQARGWDPVRSYGSAQRRKGEHKVLKECNVNSHPLSDQFEVTKLSESTEEPQADTRNNIPAGLQQPEIDPIATKLHLQSVQASGGEPTSGVIRSVETLGAWAGASLVTNLRVRGVVEVEREKFLQHGLAGASHKKDVSVAHQRQSLGPGVKPGAGERKSWTLGIWA
jgi:actin-related protein